MNTFPLCVLIEDLQEVERLTEDWEWVPHDGVTAGLAFSGRSSTLVPYACYPDSTSWNPVTIAASDHTCSRWGCSNGAPHTVQITGHSRKAWQKYRKKDDT